MMSFCTLFLSISTFVAAFGVVPGLNVFISDTKHVRAHRHVLIVQCVIYVSANGVRGGCCCLMLHAMHRVQPLSTPRERKRRV